MRTRNILLAVLLSLGVPLLGGVAYLGVRYRAARDYAAWPLSAGRDALPHFLQDRRALQSSGLFPLTTSRNADAGELLNPRLPLDGPAQQVAAHNASLKGAPDLKLGEEVLKALAQDTWPAYQPDWQRLDTGWFASLSRYDHWRPLASVPGTAAPDLLQPTVRPHLRTLLAWSKLRLLDGAHRGDVPAASREVRKLAQLLWAQDDLVHAMVGLALLRIETTFVTARRARGEALASITPLTPELQARARRYLMAYVDYLDFRAPAALRDEVLQGEGAQLGFCAAFAEARRRDLMVRPFLKRAHAREFAALLPQAEQARRLCGDSPLLAAVADENYIVPALDSGDFFATVGPDGREQRSAGLMSTRTVLATPLVRESVGYTLLSISSLNGLQMYAQPLPGAAHP